MNFIPQGVSRRSVVASIAALGAVGAVGKAALGNVRSQAEPAPPTLLDLSPYAVPGVSNSWVDVPWGGPWGIDGWNEPAYTDGTMFARLDIDLPNSGVAPPNGWPVVVYYHATGPTKTFTVGGPLDLNVKQKALLDGFAFIAVEFRHPAPMALELPPIPVLPHNDVGYSIQYIRSLHVALGLDLNQIHVICFSRGNLAIWQSMQPDLASLTAPTYAQRQSSSIQSIWSVSAQATYSTQEWAELFIVENERTAWTDCYPNDPRLGSSLRDLKALVDTSRVPPLSMVHDRPYFRTEVTVAYMREVCDSRHFPDNGLKLREAYHQKGLRDRVVAWDKEPGIKEKQIDSIPWFRAIIEGATAVEAWAIARSQRKGHQLFYVRTPYDDYAGVATGVSNGMPSGTPAPPSGGLVGGLVGVVADGSQGVLARHRSTTWAGYPAVQIFSEDRKPRLKTFQETGKLGLFFQIDDLLAVQVQNSSSQQVCYSWSRNTEHVTPAVVAPNFYQFGRFADESISLTVGSANPGSISRNDLKGYRQFANAISGSTFWNPKEDQPSGGLCDPENCSAPQGRRAINYL